MHAVLHVGRSRAGHSTVMVRVAALHREHRIDRLRHLAVVEAAQSRGRKAGASVDRRASTPSGLGCSTGGRAQARTGRAGTVTRASGDRAAYGRRGEAQTGSEGGTCTSEPTVVTLQLSTARGEARVEEQRALRPRGLDSWQFPEGQAVRPGRHVAARGRRGEGGVRLDEPCYSTRVCAGE